MSKQRRDTIHDLLWRALTALYDGDPVAMQLAIEEANAEALCALDEDTERSPAAEPMLEAMRR